MRNIFQHTLFKVFTLNGISVLIKMLVSFFSVKLYAIFIGPEGFALVGNFRNFTTSTKTLSTVGFDNGVISLVSRSQNDSSSLHKIYATAFYARLLVSLLVSAVLLCLSNYFNILFFENNHFKNIIILFAIALPFYTINTLFLSILNGLGRFKRLIIINIISTIVGFLILFLLVFYLKLKGAFLSLSVIESIVIVVTLFFLRRQGIFFSIRYLDKEILKKLLSFSAMALASAIIVPVSNFFIRNLIIENISVLQAGYWEALNRLSGYYMLIITSSITIYYLPKISSIKTKGEFRSEFKSYLSVFGIGFVILSLIVLIFKNEIITLILTSKFDPVVDLISYQLLADFIKLIVLFFGYKMISDRDVKKYLFVEVSFYVLYSILSYYFIHTLHDGIKYVVISYLISYIAMFFIMFFFYRKHLFSKYDTD